MFFLSAENNPPVQPNQEAQQGRQEQVIKTFTQMFCIASKQHINISDWVFYYQGENVEGRGDTEEGTEANDGEDTQQQPPPPPPGPSAFRIAMSFVSTFFTSLVPQHNDGIQGN